MPHRPLSETVGCSSSMGKKILSVWSLGPKYDTLICHGFFLEPVSFETVSMLSQTLTLTVLWLKPNSIHAHALLAKALKDGHIYCTD